MEVSFCKKYENCFKIGASFGIESIEKYSKILKEHFNSVTPENELKFCKVHPTLSEFRFGGSDKIVKFAQDNNMAVRGHTLVWHAQTPSWLFEDASGRLASRELLLKRMENHIGTIMDRYRNEIDVWDVVNEPIDDGDCFLRNTKWKECIGEDYIERAFQIAHEVNPKALLFLNEFNVEMDAKGEKTFELIKRLKKKGIPIDGVGIQGHYSINFPPIENIRNALERFSKLGILVHITELDVSMFSYDDHRTDLHRPLDEMKQKQIEVYREIFRALKDYKDIIQNVTLWGVADDYSWLDDFPVEGRKDWPLLFDEELKPKEALIEVCNW